MIPLIVKLNVCAPIFNELLFKLVKVIELSNALYAQIGPTAMLVPTTAAQPVLLVIDKTVGNTSFRYPDEVMAFDVAIEKV